MSEAAQLVKETSRMGTVLGIATIIVGVLAIAAPAISGVTVAEIVGIMLIAGGIARTIYAFNADSFGQGFLTFLFGGLSILCGAVMLARPLLGLASLTMVLIVYFVADGITSIIGAFQLKPTKGWGWMVFSGLVTLVLAYLLWREWPFSGAWAIGVLVGINLIFAGWSMIAVGAVGEDAAEAAELP